MKKMLVLLAIAVFTNAAFAQNATQQGAGKTQLASPARETLKTTVLFTGKPLTSEQKLQLLTTVAKVKPLTAVQPTTATLSLIPPNQMFKAGVAEIGLNNPGGVTFYPTQSITFPLGTTHQLYVTLMNVQPHVAYLLVFKVNAYIKNPQFIISDPWGHSETVNGNPGMNEIAYSFVPQIPKGAPGITFTSPNASWDFFQCEVSSIPAN